jgi:vacuolar-type H+-ATPase subunit E/Vma4
MGVEEIVRLIERDAADEATQLVDEATVEAAARCDKAEAAARAQVRLACERAEPGIAAAATRRVNAARLRLLERRAEIAAGRIDAVMTAAGETLRAIADGADRRRWGAALDRLAAETIETVGSGAIVQARAADAANVAGRVAAAGGRLERIDDPGAPAGLLVRAPDGRLAVDATLDARLGRARSRLAEDVARALRLEE